MFDLPEVPLVRMTTGGLFDAVVLDAYPDGMPIVRDRSRDTAALLLRPKNLFDFMSAMFWVDAIAERSGRIPPLVIPNLPGARQDRLNPKGDYLFTTKSIAKQINIRRFPRVVVLDPHSEVMPALIDRCEVHQSKYNVDMAPPEVFVPSGRYSGIIRPDAGAEKRANVWGERLRIPVISAGKKRDLVTGEITGFWVDTLTPGHYLVVDDLCDGGGTFVGLAEAVAETPGVTVSLFVTHGLFTKGTKTLLELYKQVYSTDSTLNAKPGVIVTNYCKQLLRDSVV